MIDIFKTSKPILALAPMDGYTDCSFREIVKKYGNPDLMFTEFVNVQGLCMGIEELFRTLQYTEFQRPIIAQLFGNDPKYFTEAALICYCLGFNGVDINMGCPSKNVTDNGSGGALIKDSKLALLIIEKVLEARKIYIATMSLGIGKDTKFLLKYFNDSAVIKNAKKLIEYILQKKLQWNIDNNYYYKESRLKDLSVSVKTRIGYDSSIVADWIQTLNTKPLDFISLHGRTLKQIYKGSVDMPSLKLAVNISNIPVLVNGDIKDGRLAKQMLEYTKSKGIMVGRASIGHPTIFYEIREYLKQNKIVSADISLKNIIQEHAEIFIKFNPNKNLITLRKHFTSYILGIENASEKRKELVKVVTLEDLNKVLNVVF